jgi:voltage-gated potassium channel
MFGLLQVLLSRVRSRPAWQYTVMAVVAMGLGATAFSLDQHVSWFVGWYWAVVTATTVGYGDVVPHGVGGRLIAMATMLTVIPLMAAAFADWASALAGLHLRRLLGMHHTAANDHWVILGFSSLIPHLLPALLDRHPSVVLVAEDVDRGHLPDHAGMDVITGDPTNPHVLAKAHLERARQVLIVGPSDGDVLMTAIEAHRLAPHGSILAVTERANAVQALRDLGIDAVDTQSWLNTFIMERLEADAARAGGQPDPQGT